MAILKTPKWISQIRETWRMTVPLDPTVRWLIPTIFIAVTGVFVLAGVAIGGFGLALAVTSWMWGLLAATYTFGRRAEKAAYTQIEGTPGAAAHVLTAMKQQWFVTPAVEINRNQELVHRLVSRAGVVLIIEARPGAAIAGVARSKTQRWIGETPMHEIFVGTGSGQVRLTELNKTVKKLPKVLRPAEVTDLRRKLDAAAGGAGNLPIPKGPMPKGMKVPRR